MPVNNGQRPAHEAIEAIVEEAEASLNGTGRVVIRPSGTEPIIRVMVQHENLRDAERMAADLAGRVGAL